MNLIIEAGGTKSNLVFLKEGVIVASYSDHGLNLTRELAVDFEKRLSRWSEFQPTPFSNVFLFAAGRMDAKKEDQFKELIARVLKSSRVYIHSDLLAACYATLGVKSGIVGILGTGSNSCYYNGTDIVKQVSPGGFILGDEGSGADIGKKLLIDYLRNDMPSEVRGALEHKFQITNEWVIQNTYGGTMKDAVNFCSGFAAFVIERVNDPYCQDICSRSINAYLNLMVNHYSGLSNQLNLVGSVAFHLTDLLKLEAKKKNLEILKITQHPVNDLSIFLAAKYQL